MRATLSIKTNAILYTKSLSIHVGLSIGQKTLTQHDTIVAIALEGLEYISLRSVRESPLSSVLLTGRVKQTTLTES